MGIVPITTEVDDSIAVMYGANVPMVCSSRAERGDDGTSKYRLVGPAYVHGIMDGEVLEARDRGEVTEEIISLM